MSRTIFFSWQSDLSNSEHRNFIENCINKAIINLSKENSVQVYCEYDRDTKGLGGSPDISNAIFGKIDKCALFVCDVSIVTGGNGKRMSPNPNVLLELGYASKQLGWDKVICLFNNKTGAIDDLPFDLRQKRILQYNPSIQNERQRITAILEDNIKSLYVSGKLFNPLNDYMKGRIDKNLLDVSKQISNILYGTVTMSDGLSHVTDFLNMTPSMIKDRLENAIIHGFIIFNNYQQVSLELREILREILSSSFFAREWTYTVIEAIDWIRSYDYFISKRNPKYPLEIVDGKSCNEYAAILGESLNALNPKNTYIVLEVFERDGERRIDTQEGRVINTTQYPIDRVYSPDPFEQYFMIKKVYLDNAKDIFWRFSQICRDWLKTTDSEFILNPDYYYVQ